MHCRGEQCSALAIRLGLRRETIAQRRAIRGGHRANSDQRRYLRCAETQQARHRDSVTEPELWERWTRSMLIQVSRVVRRSAGLQ